MPPLMRSSAAPVGRGNEGNGKQLTVNSTIAALIPFIIVLVAFQVYCLLDLYRANQVRYFPKWLWVIICFLSVPIGGIVYLVFGRER
jgi:hypothetical protein